MPASTASGIGIERQLYNFVWPSDWVHQPGGAYTSGGASEQLPQPRHWCEMHAIAACIFTVAASFSAKHPRNTFPWWLIQSVCVCHNVTWTQSTKGAWGSQAPLKSDAARGIGHVRGWWRRPSNGTQRGFVKMRVGSLSCEFVSWSLIWVHT